MKACEPYHTGMCTAALVSDYGYILHRTVHYSVIILVEAIHEARWEDVKALKTQVLWGPEDRQVATQPGSCLRPIP